MLAINKDGVYQKRIKVADAIMMKIIATAAIISSHDDDYDDDDDKNDDDDDDGLNDNDNDDDDHDDENGAWRIIRQAEVIIIWLGPMGNTMSLGTGKPVEHFIKLLLLASSKTVSPRTLTTSDVVNTRAYSPLRSLNSRNHRAVLRKTFVPEKFSSKRIPLWN